MYPECSYYNELTLMIVRHYVCLKSNILSELCERTTLEQRTSILPTDFYCIFFVLRFKLHKNPQGYYMGTY